MEQLDSNANITSSIYCQLTTDNRAGNINFHIHDCCEIYYLVDGHINYYVDQSLYTMEAGDMIIISDLEIHKAINLTEHPFTRKIIHINPNYVRPFSTKQTDLLACFYNHPLGLGNHIHLNAEQRALYLKYFDTLYSSNTSEEYGHDLLTLSSLFTLLVDTNNWYKTSKFTTNTQNIRVLTIMNYIDNHLTEPLTLDEISTAMYMDKFYMSHLFRKLTASSIFQYILIKRVALAKELLCKGHDVTMACHLSGFNDYSNFLRTFKKMTGYTPGHFRKNNT